jgi:hypothetical protein
MGGQRKAENVSGFKPMKEEEIRELLKDQVDVLTPLIKEEEAFLRSKGCPKCGRMGAQSLINTRRPFVSNNPLPCKLLQCLACDTEFDPYTGIITRVGG